MIRIGCLITRSHAAHLALIKHIRLQGNILMTVGHCVMKHLRTPREQITPQWRGMWSGAEKCCNSLQWLGFNQVEEGSGSLLRNKSVKKGNADIPYTWPYSNNNNNSCNKSSLALYGWAAFKIIVPVDTVSSACHKRSTERKVHKQVVDERHKSSSQDETQGGECACMWAM